MISVEPARVGRSLQLGTGVACAVVGAEAILAPASFVRGVLVPYGFLGAGWLGWGAAFIAVGSCLAAISVLEVRRSLLLATSAGATLLLLAISVPRIAAQDWLDAAVYACSGLAIAAIASVPRQLPALPTPARWPIGVLLVGVGLGTTAQRHDWATTALLVCLGVAIVVGPLVIPSRLQDFGSIRVRLVLMTLILTGGPLIMASLAIAMSAETAAIDDALGDEVLTAGEGSHALDQADSDYRGVVTTIAQRAGLATLSVEQQRPLLQSLTATNVYAFSTYDRAGQPLARSDDLPLAALPSALMARLAQAGAAVSGVGNVPGTERPALIFAAPYLDANGAVAGFAAAEVDFAQLTQALAALAPLERPGTSVFVLDASGAPLLHPVPSGSGGAPRPPVIDPGRLTSGDGNLRYRAGGVEYAAGFSEAASLGWTVVSTYPIASAIAGVENGREGAFGLLVLTCALSTILGLFVADRVVRPLNALSNAIDDLAAEAVAAPLPHSSFTEVQRMSRLFGAMRQRLAIRTAERETALRSAREAIQARDEFMSIAAHELKTPVTAMRGHAQLLMKHLHSRDVLDRKRLSNSLERIDSQSRKLARLIEQLLDVARLERGTLRIDPHEVDLRSVVAEVLLENPQRHRIVTRLPDVPVLVNADEGRLEQVLANLVDNALKFSPEGGDVEIELQAPTRDTARLTVSDQGLGIPAEHSARVFERFHQAHAESHRSGFGLGLYIAKQIVDLHAGSIHIDSSISGGTRVWVDLPRVAPAKVPA